MTNFSTLIGAPKQRCPQPKVHRVGNDGIRHASSRQYSRLNCGTSPPQKASFPSKEINYFILGRTGQEVYVYIPESGLLVQGYPGEKLASWQTCSHTQKLIAFLFHILKNELTAKYEPTFEEKKIDKNLIKHHFYLFIFKN